MFLRSIPEHIKTTSKKNSFSQSIILWITWLGFLFKITHNLNSAWNDGNSQALTLWCIISQNGQTHFKNLAANAARFLNCAWPFWDIMHYRAAAIYTSAKSGGRKKGLSLKCYSDKLIDLVLLSIIILFVIKLLHWCCMVLMWCHFIMLII